MQSRKVNLDICLTILSQVQFCKILKLHGLSEVITLAQQGEVRILASTAPERISAAQDTPTMLEIGVDMTFTNWRGFFAAPGLKPERIVAFRELIKQMYEQPQWQKIRESRGWNDLFIEGREFDQFLQTQEKELGNLLVELGFLKP